MTEAQVKQHAENGACTPRQIASACKAGTDCGGCVRRIQALLGRGACPRRGADRPAGPGSRTAGRRRLASPLVAARAAQCVEKPPVPGPEESGWLCSMTVDR
ncbi:(2Fe-2S)-binding protein [Streptomyces tricolor]|nr:(2Fe-2S)-binding protein [Streptomyces tricolor]